MTYIQYINHKVAYRNTVDRYAGSPSWHANFYCCLLLWTIIIGKDLLESWHQVTSLWPPSLCWLASCNGQLLRLVLSYYRVIFLLNSEWLWEISCGASTLDKEKNCMQTHRQTKQGCKHTLKLIGMSLFESWFCFESLASSRKLGPSQWGLWLEVTNDKKCIFSQLKLRLYELIASLKAGCVKVKPDTLWHPKGFIVILLYFDLKIFVSCLSPPQKFLKWLLIY